MSSRGEQLLLRALLLGVVVCWLATPARAEDPEFYAEVSITHRPVLLAYWTRGFAIAFQWWTPLSEAEFSDHFPAVHAGGNPSTCGIRSREGVSVSLADTVTWSQAYVRSNESVWAVSRPELHLAIIAPGVTGDPPRTDSVFNGPEVEDGDGEV